MSEIDLPHWASAPPSWITTPGQDCKGIVLSSRIRLARNIEGTPFSHNAPISTQKKILETIVNKTKTIPELKTSHFFHLTSLTPLQKNFLVERHLISHEHARNKGEKGLIVSSGETLSIMVNEEDHIRAASFESGMGLRKAWENIARLDHQLTKCLSISFDGEFGFITACPTNTGSGLRASCLMHLPGLTMTKQIESIAENCARNHLVMRGFYGEGTQPRGHIYQVSNAITLGKTEENQIKVVEKAVSQIVNEEKRAQKLLFSPQFRLEAENIIYRSFGTLQSARLLNFEEGMDRISHVRLGILNGLDIRWKLSDLTNMFFLIQPSHLMVQNTEESENFLDSAIRAQFVRSHFGEK